MNNFYDVMTKLFDSKRAYENVNIIHSLERWISYDKFVEGAKFCEKAMLEAGLSEVERLELKADGKTFYGDHILPRAWCAYSATLSIANGEVLCDYSKIPCSLSMYSAPTGQDGITAELAVVDDLSSYYDNDSLKGKIILVKCGSAGAVDFAKRVGAVGILCDAFPLFPGVRDSREQMRGIHRWDCLFDSTMSLFAFSLAPEQGDRLRLMAKEGTVKLHAKVDSAFTDDSLYVISACIPGSEPDLPEFILYGHLDEPGANDNASGCGGLLELFRSLKLAIDTGKLMRPRNTLRLAMGPEYKGSIGYIYYHPERERLGFASADMIGNESADKTHMYVRFNPLSNRSYVDGAITLAHKIYCDYSGDNMCLGTRSFTQGSDNFVADPSLNTPAIGFGNFPAESYHSSADTMDRIEADILKRNTLIVGCLAYMLAIADEKICNAIAGELKLQGTELLNSAKTERQRKLYHESYLRSLYSLKRIYPLYNMDYDFKEESENIPTYAKQHGGDRIPVRLVKGPVFFEANPELKSNSLMRCDTATPLNWTNGERTLWDITVRSAVENRMDSDETLKELFFEYTKVFDCLEKYNYISFKK